MSDKVFLSFSGGTESSTLCCLFGHKATAIFADAGWEHAVMYQRLDEVEKKIQERHPDFRVVRVKAKNVKGHGPMTLPEYIAFSKFYPSPIVRYCTVEFKIKPIDEYLSSQGPCELMIGLNYDERDQRVGNHGLMANVTYSYPLVDLKMTREDCVGLLNDVGLAPKFPSYMSRGGCIGCFFKKRKEFAAMAVETPAEAYSVADLEDAIQDNREEKYHVHGSIKNMRQFIDHQRMQGILFTEKDEVSPQETPCGVFCNR